MEINLVAEGAKFMVLGMGTVFIFLLLLIGWLNIQAALVAKFFKPEEKVSTPASSQAAAPAVKKDDKQLVAAMTAAITSYKKKHQ